MIRMTSRRQSYVYSLFNNHSKVECIYRLKTDNLMNSPDILTQATQYKAQIGDELELSCIQKAEDLWGRPLDEAVAKRIRQEMNHIRSADAAVMVRIFCDIQQTSQMLGYEISGRETGSSFVAYLLGLTPINPMKYDIPRYNSTFRYYPASSIIGEEFPEDFNINLSLNLATDIFDEVLDRLIPSYGPYELLGAAPELYWSMSLPDLESETYYSQEKYICIILHRDEKIGILSDLQKETGEMLIDIPLTDPETWEHFGQNLLPTWITKGLWAGTQWAIQGIHQPQSDEAFPYINLYPKSFIELCQYIGFNLVENNNASTFHGLLAKHTMEMVKTFNCIEALDIALQSLGVEELNAYRFSKMLRRGFNMECNENNLDEMLNIKLPDWLITCSREITYISSYATILNLSLFIYWTAYYYVHYGQEFESIITHNRRTHES